MEDLQINENKIKTPNFCKSKLCMKRASFHMAYESIYFNTNNASNNLKFSDTQNIAFFFYLHNRI